jgi:hypothetical protein
MFNFGKKAKQDPKKALENASNLMNKGIMGGITKGFMGKDFVDKANSAIGMANQILDGSEVAEKLKENGTEADAEVLSIQDTGATANMNPVVVLTLNVSPPSGQAFQTAAQIMVQRLAIPRPGDKIKIKYNHENPAQFVIL